MNLATVQVKQSPLIKAKAFRNPPVKACFNVLLHLIDIAELCVSDEHLTSLCTPSSSMQEMSHLQQFQLVVTNFQLAH